MREEEALEEEEEGGIRARGKEKRDEMYTMRLKQLLQEQVLFSLNQRAGGRN